MTFFSRRDHHQPEGLNEVTGRVQRARAGGVNMRIKRFMPVANTLPARMLKRKHYPRQNHPQAAERCAKRRRAVAAVTLIALAQTRANRRDKQPPGKGAHRRLPADVLSPASCSRHQFASVNTSSAANESLRYSPNGCFDAMHSAIASSRWITMGSNRRWLCSQTGTDRPVTGCQCVSH